MENEITLMIESLKSVEQDYEKATNGNKAAALRVKAVLLEIKKKSQWLRGVLTPPRNER